MDKTTNLGLPIIGDDDITSWSLLNESNQKVDNAYGTVVNSNKEISKKVDEFIDDQEIKNEMLDDDIFGIESDVENLKEFENLTHVSISTLTSNLNDFSELTRTSISGLTSNVNAFENLTVSSVSRLTSNVNSLRTEVESNTNSIEQVDSRVSTLANTTSEEFTEVVQSVESIRERVSKNETDINSLNTEYSTLSETVDDNEHEINKINSNHISSRYFSATIMSSENNVWIEQIKVSKGGSSFVDAFRLTAYSTATNLPLASDRATTSIIFESFPDAGSVSYTDYTNDSLSIINYYYSEANQTNSITISWSVIALAEAISASNMLAKFKKIKVKIYQTYVL